MKKICTLLLMVAIAMSKINAQSWSLTGNSGTAANTNFVGTKDNKGLVFRTNNTERMRISNSGSVGIGTSTLDGRLTVASTNQLSLTTGGDFIIGSKAGQNMAFNYNVIQGRYGVASNGLFINYYGGSVWIGNHKGDGSLPVFYASPGGSAAVGSSNYNPNYALTINTSLAGNGIFVTDPYKGFVLNATKSGSGNAININSTNTNNNDAVIFTTNAGLGAGVEAYSQGTAVYASSDGYYGEGVVGYSFYNEGITGSGGYAGVRGIGYEDNSYGVLGFSLTGYAGYFDGNVYSTGIYQGSDEKLKQNIKDFSSAMDIINQLHPKNYNYRHDGNYKLMNLPQGNHYGLIAQEVEKILPDLIKDTKFETRMVKPHTSEEDINNSEAINFKALNYTELIPIMIKGMQEQQQQIKKLEKVIEKLSGNSNTSASNLPLENSGASLKQNAPNPFTQNTTIYCNVPSSAKLAQLMIYNQEGSQIKSFALTGGINNITISAGSLPSGQYVYSLLLDGKNIDNKKMILTK